VIEPDIIEFERHRRADIVGSRRDPEELVFEERSARTRREEAGDEPERDWFPPRVSAGIALREPMSPRSAHRR
jgi:hypothetical protein